jgi:hypothetical protein
LRTSLFALPGHQVVLAQIGLCVRKVGVELGIQRVVKIPRQAQIVFQNRPVQQAAVAKPAGTYSRSKCSLQRGFRRREILEKLFGAIFSRTVLSTL